MASAPDVRRDLDAGSVPDARLDAAPAASRVALVNMPWAFADRPSIQCGLLKSCLVQAGHDVDVHYLNLELAVAVGAALYHEVAHMRTDLLLGDWLFSGAAFDRQGDEAAYRETFPTLDEFCTQVGITFEAICTLRNETLPAWIAAWADNVDWGQYAIVGFTTTFEQNAAAMGLARAIKARHPGVTTVFGGSNFDGDMGREYVRKLSYIDYAVIGEGDQVFPQLVSLLARGESPISLPGVAARNNGALSHVGAAPMTRDMDSLPDPDYDEYFSTLFRLGQHNVLRNVTPLLLYESARGCWWGEKQHCTFCGLNNNGMAFRAKSPERTLGELRRLAQRYKIVNFEAVDNIIDYRYLETLCEPLSQQHYDFRLFYETKANVTPAQLRKMARAGIRSLQPGIESMSSHVLALMRKGVTMLRNVRCVKWAYYYGMRISWNILTGFPGETEEDYIEQNRVLRAIRHLPPPMAWGRLWLERFSPFYFDRTFPVSEIRPLDGYRFIYPEQEIDLDKIAYFFKYEMADTVRSDFHHEMGEIVGRWKHAWEKGARPALMYQRAPDWIQVIDRRDPEAKAHAFGAIEAAVYEFCGETERTVPNIVAHLVESEGIDENAETISAIVNHFCALDLMLTERGRYLSLALPANPHW